MNEYKKGREHLEKKAFSAAKECFLTGADQDPKCVYGLVAASAAAGESFGQELKRLEDVLPELMRLAESKDAEACFAVARCYETGTVLERDIPAAMKYYTRAAALEHPDAMFNLGCIYMMLGDGKIAQSYFKQAASLGCVEAVQALRHMGKEKDRNEMKHNQGNGILK